MTITRTMIYYTMIVIIKVIIIIILHSIRVTQYA